MGGGLKTSEISLFLVKCPRQIEIKPNASMVIGVKLLDIKSFKTSVSTRNKYNVNLCRNKIGQSTKAKTGLIKGKI